MEIGKKIEEAIKKTFENINKLNKTDEKELIFPRNSPLRKTDGGEPRKSERNSEWAYPALRTALPEGEGLVFADAHTF
ncbi:MAG: hypothetical protein IKY83_13905 [Proteobacteria bacterium]|nr:hypothetical protein [Pseudomonadota bacterium]